ncbi:uncharacterized protein LOC109600172 [Aethina tumida]|uniref:uncharacterized protein LOC109600172 n=1 Tax=Aethina tumida TaxID=116153 RepID=UPI00096B1522|nr:uncharacterized protein LOC109600172 [Aethina tumida]
MRAVFKVVLVCLFVVLVLSCCEGKKKKGKKNSKQMILRQKETNPINFIRLAVMRLVYGIATRIGFGEQISEALNGAFVPPGVDDYEDFGGADGFFDRDDDYDY